MSTDDDDKQKGKKIFLGQEGMPTGPDVTLLQKYYDNLQPGDVMPYDEVSDVIKTPKKLPNDALNRRWISVTNAWRRAEKEKGLVIKCTTNEAFYVANSSQIIASTIEVARHVGKTFRKQRGDLSTINPATESEKEIKHHHMLLMHTGEREAKKIRMNLIPSTTTHTIPQIPPPKEKESK